MSEQKFPHITFPVRVWVDHDIDDCPPGTEVAAYTSKTSYTFEYLSLAECEEMVRNARAEAFEEAFVAMRTERNSHGVGFTDTEEGRWYRRWTGVMLDRMKALRDLDRAKAARDAVNVEDGGKSENLESRN